MTILSRVVEIKGFRPAVIAALVAVCLYSAYLGITGIMASPIFINQNGNPTILLNYARIQSIAGIDIDDKFFVREPIFTDTDEVEQWWRVRRQLQQAFSNTDSVVVNYGDYNELYSVIFPTGKQSIQRLQMVYLIALIYVLGAVFVYFRHRTVASFILSVYLIGGGVYLFSAGAIYQSYLILPEWQLKQLVASSYLSSCFLMAGIHFALVFPRQKPLVRRLPIPIPVLLYGYSLTILILYLFIGSVLSSYTWPLFTVWSCVLVGLWLHSIVTETDVLLKKQLSYSLIIPIGGTILLPIIYFDPDLLGFGSIKFSDLSLMFLIYLLGVLMYCDSAYAYFQRERLAEHSNQQKERLRRDLHDGILNKLANISLLSEASIRLMDENRPEAAAKVRSIKSHAAEYSRYARGLLWITGDRCSTWDEYFANLRRYGYDLIGNYDIDFELELEFVGDSIPMPTLQLKVCLYYVLMEAISNILKHAKASCIVGRLTVKTTGVELSIADNGIGISQHNEIKESYGLSNMRHRAEELGGSLGIVSAGNGGTHINLNVPA